MLPLPKLAAYKYFPRILRRADGVTPVPMLEVLDNTPVTGAMSKVVTVASPLFATNKNFPLGSTDKAFGAAAPVVPVVNGEPGIGFRNPSVAIVYPETLGGLPEFATYKNFPALSVATAAGEGPVSAYPLCRSCPLVRSTA